MFVSFVCLHATRHVQGRLSQSKQLHDFVSNRGGRLRIIPFARDYFVDVLSLDDGVRRGADAFAFFRVFGPPVEGAK